MPLKIETININDTSYNIPMRHKYLDEFIKPLYIFGIHENGNVDIVNTNGDVFTNVKKETAEKIVRANQLYMQHLYSILCNFTDGLEDKCQD